MPVRIQVTEYLIQLVAESTDPSFHKLLAEVHDVKKIRNKNTYHVSIHKLPEVLRILRGITSVDQIPSGTIKDLYTEEMQRRRYTKVLKEQGPSITDAVLWPHQCLGVELAQVNRRYNFYYDTRTGKTLMCLRIMYDRLKAGMLRRCLIICPPNIIKAWLDDAAKYFPELKIVAYYGDKDNRLETLRTPAHIVVWATTQIVDNLDTLKTLKFGMCIFDESSKIKNHQTKLAAAALELSEVIPSWYNLSATPAPNSKSEYYVQMRCIDPCIFDYARTNFVNRYFENISRDVKYEKLRLRPEMEQELLDKIEEHSLYVDQNVMPTAGKEWIVVKYSLGAEARSVYETMREDMYAELTGVTILAKRAAEMRAKLNQIASGFIMDTEARKENAISRRLKEPEENAETEIYRLLESNRTACLSNILRNEHSNKCIIWANYKEEFRVLEDLLGSSARYINGGTSTAEKERYIYDDFKHGDVQFLVCHPMSVGMGINLTEAHVAIYFSLNDSWEAFKQSSERIYGHIAVQPNKCRYYVILAADTVNELIYSNLLNKRDASTGFLEYLRSGAL